MFQFDAKLSTAVEVDHRPLPAPKPASRPLSPGILRDMQLYWQAANYLTVGQIYLQENPLLREPLKPEHIKPRLLGHWGTSSGQDRKSTRLNSSHMSISYAVFCLKKKKKKQTPL